MLLALPYHQVTTTFFQTQPEVWQFFANITHKEEQIQQFKIDLLKNSYKFDSISDSVLYNKVDIAKEKLNMQTQVCLYQAENSEEMNASVAYSGGEVHIIFSGKLIQLLSDEELLAIISHELSHVQLFTQFEGKIEIADRIIKSISNNVNSTPAHYETARLFRLYTEIFCDRGAYQVTGNYNGIISALVKMSTGLPSVNADNYIKQAEEIFSMDGNVKTAGVTHPENFIRARAISLWQAKGNDANSDIQEMIEGNIGLDELDIFRQQHLSSITEKIIKLIMQPRWMQSPLTISLSKQYFPSIQYHELVDHNELLSPIERLHSNLQDYLAYVLYDFATADKELEDLPLGHCFYIAEELKLNQNFLAAVKKEYKLTDKKVSLLKQRAIAEYNKQKDILTV